VLGSVEGAVGRGYIRDGRAFGLTTHRHAYSDLPGRASAM